MDKTKLIPALIISIAILVLLIITTVVTNINKGNKTNTSEGESYLAALESQDVKKVENNLRDSDTTNPETTDSQAEETSADKETEAPTDEPGTKPEETEAPTKATETQPAAKPDNNSGTKGSRQVFTEVTSRVICRIPLTAIKHPLWQTNWQREQFPPKRSSRIPFLSVTQ